MLSQSSAKLNAHLAMNQCVLCKQLKASVLFTSIRRAPCIPWQLLTSPADWFSVRGQPYDGAVSFLVSLQCSILLLTPVTRETFAHASCIEAALVTCSLASTGSQIYGPLPSPCDPCQESPNLEASRNEARQANTKLSNHRNIRH